MRSLRPVDACRCVRIDPKSRYVPDTYQTRNLFFGVCYPHAGVVVRVAMPPVGMAHKTADKLVYCHEAVHVQLRMQDAGWHADVERWESDEDSDDSGDELDADESAGLQMSEEAVLLLMA